MKLKHRKRYIAIAALLLGLTGCRKKPEPSVTVSPEPTEPTVIVETSPVPDLVEAEPTPSASITPEPELPAISEDTECDDKECVALYIYTWSHLPSNYMTKKEARAAGWEGGALSKVVKGKAIGGDYYGNYEGTLPEGASYLECDIDTIGRKSRGSKRIVFTEDGEFIYYTEDHYETFELLYGEE
ncbi:MAG: ribonuclease [Solobacterium sp.]|nr:ribonuclease [Solobacterium sp.]